MLQHVCIIGGGVIGSSTALALATAGTRVTLIERGAIGGESSWAGAGLLSPLLPWHYAGAVTHLTEWSRALYPAWVDELQAASGIDPGFRVSGMLVLPPYDLSAARAWATSHTESVQELAARTMLPELGVESRALWMSEVAQVRNPRLLQALRQALLRHNVQILENTEVTGLRETRSHIAAVTTVRGEFSADKFVFATGAWSPSVLAEQGANIPIHPVRGQILLFKSEPRKLKHIVYCDGLYIIPRDDGHILVGSTLEEVGFDKSVTEAARSDLTKRAIVLLPFLGTTPVVGHWAGLRPGSPDNIPIMSRHPTIENLYLSSGHFRYGVTMAPASAALMANLIFGRPNPIDVSPYQWPA